MKITDQDIPAELAALYARYLTPMVATATPQATLRTRRAAKLTKTPRQRRKKDLLAIFMPAARGLAHQNWFNAADPGMLVWLKARAQELRDATINLSYWFSQNASQTQNHTITPSSVPDSAPGPYTYRDSGNLPSVMTYGTGSNTTLGLHYAGATTGGYFTDTNLRWIDCTRTLGDTADNPEIYPVLLYLDYTFTATASARGSRPMFSFLIRFMIQTNKTWTSGDQTPPTKSDRSLYYPYEPPIGSAPFYSATLQRKLVIVPKKKHIEIDTSYARAKIAIRPLFGRGYNNNTSVDVSATGTLKFLSPRQPAKTNYLRVTHIAGTTYARESADNRTYDLWDISPAIAMLAVDVTRALLLKDDGRWAWTIWGESMPTSIAADPAARIQSDAATGTFMIYTGSTLINPGSTVDQAAIWATGTRLYQSMEFANGTLSGFTQRCAAMLPVGLYLMTDGEVYNHDLGSHWILPWAKSTAPIAAFDTQYLIQRDTGQWYRFDQPTNRGGYYGDGTTPQTITTGIAVGEPTPLGAAYLITPWGIAWQDAQVNGSRWRLINRYGNQGIMQYNGPQPGTMIGYSA